MSADKFKNHLIIIPEDDANRQIANGFENALTQKKSKAIQVLPIARGWKKVLDTFHKEHISNMRKYPKRNVLLLIDFDVKEGGAGHDHRLDYMKESIPADLKNRVFVLGSLSNPEDLKKANNSPNTFEDIGKALAQDCFDGTNLIWGHDLLDHNQDDLKLMKKSVKPFLF